MQKYEKKNKYTRFKNINSQHPQQRQQKQICSCSSCRQKQNLTLLQRHALISYIGKSGECCSCLLLMQMSENVLIFHILPNGNKTCELFVCAHTYVLYVIVCVAGIHLRLWCFKQFCCNLFFYFSFVIY